MKIFTKNFFNKCRLCGRFCSFPLCSECRLRLREEMLFLKFKTSDRTDVFVLSLYHGVVKELMEKYKFNADEKISYVFSACLGQALSRYGIDRDKTLFLFAPSSREGQRSRGFNQMQLLLSKTELKAADVFRINKKYKGEAQKKLGRSERIKSSAGKFILDGKVLLSAVDGGCFTDVVFADDIWTTGSTMMNCLVLIKHFFAENNIKGVNVSGLVLAKAESYLAF